MSDPQPDLDLPRTSARLDRAIELKQFEIACVEAIVEDGSRASDQAWLLSVFAGAIGPVLAVTQGRNARQWASVAAAMREELAQLQLERRLLERGL